MNRLSSLIFCACAGILIGVVLFDQQQLPSQIASHFDGAGNANGWSSRASFTGWMLGLGLGMPAFVCGVMYSIRFFPSSLLNVPHPEYWRAPQNYGKACDFLFRSSLWFGSAFLLWQAAFSHLIATANLSTPPKLDGSQVALVTAFLLIATAAWIVTLLWFFFRLPAGRQNPATPQDAP